MDIVPVIDLKGGQVVHARGGKRRSYKPIATPLSASSAPADVVRGLLALHPFRRLYIADLDAIERTGDHSDTLAKLQATFPGMELWVDNGIGDLSTAEEWLDGDFTYLVMGSESQANAEALRRFHAHPRVLLSLDFRGSTFQGPREILDNPALWPSRVLVMTLARVGSGAGPDLARVEEIVRRAGSRRVYASGGVRNVTDLQALSAIGAAGALVATALHTGAITAEDMKKIARR
jgi:phosphoribosylformimino-5-aminoimidazole carboxamide ribotide isomerase